MTYTPENSESSYTPLNHKPTNADFFLVNAVTGERMHLTPIQIELMCEGLDMIYDRATHEPEGYVENVHLASNIRDFITEEI